MCQPGEMNPMEPGCDGLQRWNRRRFLQSSAIIAGAAGWLTPIAELLARDSESEKSGKPPKSLIMIWLQGGPSQLETFDPHPGTKIGGDAKAIDTSVKGIQFADSMPASAEQMHRIALLRSVVSKEGDHERATYNVKTGWRPEPTIVHPSIGAVLCHQLQDNMEIPRHISILSGQWPARGGYLGSSYDAFQIGDPKDPLPNLTRNVEETRTKNRLDDLSFVEQKFAAKRFKQLDLNKTLHETSTARAVKMMDSQQLTAFDIKKESQSTVEKFGDTPFGRGCLAAVRLIEAGVRCVEVELSGWDTHVTNHTLQYGRAAILDRAYAAMLELLAERDLLDRTIVFCGGEFGRTPQINPAEGRDHWPHGFSIALAGGGLRSGFALGATAANPKLDQENHEADIERPITIPDVHATILSALQIDYQSEHPTPIGRPFVFSEGKPIAELLES